MSRTSSVTWFELIRICDKVSISHLFSLFGRCFYCVPITYTYIDARLQFIAEAALGKSRNSDNGMDVENPKSQNKIKSLFLTLLRTCRMDMSAYVEENLFAKTTAFHISSISLSLLQWHEDIFQKFINFVSTMHKFQQLDKDAFSCGFFVDSDVLLKHFWQFRTTSILTIEIPCFDDIFFQKLNSTAELLWRERAFIILIS